VTQTVQPPRAFTRHTAPRPLERGEPVAAHPLTSVILPAYNEAEALPGVLGELSRVLDEHYEIIVVDDGSSDETAAIAGRFPCRILRHSRNRGKGAAIRTGLNHALGQYIVVSDADGTYPADAIPRIAELLAAYDLVRCKRPRNSEHMPVVNRVGNWLFDQLLSLLHGLDGADHLSGLYGLRRAAVLRLNLVSSGFDIEAEIGVKARVRGLRVAAFPVDYQPRVGEKKLRAFQDGFHILSRIIALVLLYNPLLTFVIPGLLILALMLGGALLLSRGPVVTPYFGLSIHSFIVAALGSLAAFQLITFGMSAALYAVEAGDTPPRWLVRLSSRPLRLGTAIIGFGLTLAALVDMGVLIGRWILAGLPGLFDETRALVLASAVLVGGLQLLSAALYLSIFAGRLQRLEKEALLDEDEL
jgi:glycosyltransferase involved in cell wall biosynthesis